MKPRDINSYDGQNWAWPEKTWFRERLNAIKAREHETRRRPTVNTPKSMAVETKSGGDEGNQEG